MKILKLTNYDDWEAYYEVNNNTGDWELIFQGHRVRMDDLLKYLADIDLIVMETDFGEKYVTNRLEEFCKKNSLTYTTLWKSSITNTSSKKGKCKDWICKKEENKK